MPRYEARVYFQTDNPLDILEVKELLDDVMIDNFNEIHDCIVVGEEKPDVEFIQAEYAFTDALPTLYVPGEHND